MSPTGYWSITFQVIGTGIAILGLISTDLRFGTRTPRVRDAIMRRLSGAAHSVRRLIQWLIGRPLPRYALTSTPLGDRFSATPLKGEPSMFDPIDPALSLPKKFEMLEARQFVHLAMINELSKEAADREDATDRLEAELVSTSSSLRSEIEQQVRKVAIEGLSLTAIGLGISLVGIVFSLWS